ncbi:MAG: hypothetical protein ACI4PD_02615, partial [Butyricicoccus sp.]
GCVHALIDRMNVSFERKGKPRMSRKMQDGLTVVILVLSLALSQVGVIDLIGAGYTYLAYAYILLYLVPIFTVGIYKIVKYNKKGKETV